MRWEFTPDEFIYLWTAIGSDRYPAPLSLLASACWRHEWEATERDLRERLPVLDDPDLFPVLRTAANPDTSAVLVGNRKRPLRAYGAVIADIGVTIVQRAGTDHRHGGAVIVQVGSALLVPKVLTAVAGDCPPGRAASMVETYERLRYPPSSHEWGSEEATTAQRMRQILAASRTGNGHIEIQTERRTEKPPPPRYLSWFDVHNDGRYVYMRRYNDFHIDPCSSDGLRHGLTRLMDLT
ncbi:ESX secretion-associated protein EspG [Nocardia sp. NPDC050793]|uniref:ESX secretion-associated protein EspG n=1 Tax=Nocardia sp. NPDC050793 TaxID=3155159 RepID=UPI0033E294A4